ncbi:MAG: anti-sigma factor family protein [Chloroflexota bacterium]
MHLTEEQIHSYTDGLLEEPARQNAEAHLSGCRTCRARLEELQHLFASLERLPDLPLGRDLTPGILAKLPPERGRREFRPTPAWTRSLAAQWGLVTGFALWLGIRAAATLDLLASWQFNLPALPLDILPDQFPIPQIPISQLPTYTLPIYQLPAFDFQSPAFFFPLSSSHLTLLLALAALLWVMGNAVLLRSRPEVQK